MIIVTIFQAIIIIILILRTLFLYDEKTDKNYHF
mgnify:CR=1 FL=1